MPVWRGLFVATASWNIIALAVYVLGDFYSLLMIALLLLGGAFFENEEGKKGNNVSSDLLFLLFSPLCQLPSLPVLCICSFNRPSIVLLIYPHVTLKWSRHTSRFNRRLKASISPLV